MPILRPPSLVLFPFTEALSHYDRAIERLKAGDWAGFGKELDTVRPLLE